MGNAGRPGEAWRPLPCLRPRPAIFRVLIWVFIWIFIVLGILACNGSATTSLPAVSPLIADPPAEAATSVSLPGDEGTHDTSVEWWYFNGHLTDEEGDQYSFHFVAFQSEAIGGVTPHLFQLSWADHARGEHITDEKPAFITVETTPDLFDISTSGWRMRGDGSIYDLTFDTGQYSVDLRAVSAKPAALHQGTGLVSLGRAGETFYYSRTRLEVSGSVTLAGTGGRLPVQGVSWMDHQWGELTVQPVGWDWLSLQLEDGSELMAALVWDPEGHEPIAQYGTYVAIDGSAHSLDGGEIVLTPSGSWTSPTTGTVYPMGWSLGIDSLALSVELIPVQQDAEFGDSRYAPAAYWEGAVSVTGAKEGQAVSGVGFVEMVGYDPRQIDPPLPPRDR
ncbi:MAG: hypothetical protein BZY88_06315 [SAR202 cluster bacterium Io17-Chloro-G9]|nr:MAG: hypothetical protein BZY88_06315 [SAR202 cluster bacterium Io17-Chloro-G9]